MTGYTKLFGSIIASTIWREPKETKIVWITMLAMADKIGMVEASLPGLADLARVSVEECRTAIACLEAPDPDSRTREHEGRRIKPVEGGWILLNHAKYRAKMDAEDRARYKREWDRQNRNSRPNNAYRNITPDSPPNNPRQNPTHPTHSDSEAASDSDKGKGTLSGKSRKPETMTAARVLIHYLNEKTGRAFRESESSFRFICPRLEEPDVTLWNENGWTFVVISVCLNSLLESTR